MALKAKTKAVAKKAAPKAKAAPMPKKGATLLTIPVEVNAVSLQFHKNKDILNVTWLSGAKHELKQIKMQGAKFVVKVEIA